MDIIRFTITFLLISCWAFFFGFKLSQDYGLDQCKEAGWSFIEKKILPKDLTHLKSLQSTLATECIVRFRPKE